MPAMSRGGGKSVSSRSSAKAVKPTTKRPSKVVKPKKARQLTESSRKHHFESFSQRIAKLKIDPIRRTRRPDDIVDPDSDTTSSYFGTSLDEWRDLNLSENFTNFYKEVATLVESLPMVLHNEDRIMDILVRYLEKEDVNALEPILALLAHFAHDLDVRFEKHFQRAVAVVTKIAAKIEAPEAIEWSFTCLAWLFKYLSRLLVPDLRPLFDLLAPLLGKERQKPFVIRFAAEAMSFLVRKAGTMWEKRREPLEVIVRYMMEDYNRSKQSNPYGQGLMTLFTESIKGVQGTLHSGGSAVLRCLINVCLDMSKSDQWDSSLEVLKGSLISLVHHTDAESFQAVQDTVLEIISMEEEGQGVQRVHMDSQLLFTIVATRKGDRISDWAAVVKQTAKLVKRVDSAPTVERQLYAPHVLNTLALVFQTAPYDAIISELSVLDLLLKRGWVEHFLPFCYLFADLDQGRFDSALLSHFQRFIANHWEEQEATLCCVLPDMSAKQILSARKINFPAPWEAKMTARVERLSQDAKSNSTDSEELPLLNGELAVTRYLSCNQDTDKVIRSRLAALATQRAMSGGLESSAVSRFALGKAFLHASNTREQGLFDQDALQSLISVAPRYKTLLSYWFAVHASLQKLVAGSDKLPIFSDDANEALIECLSAPLHDLRAVALSILSDSYRLRSLEVPELLQVAMSIEDTPTTVQSSRFISSQIRRLALGYKEGQKDVLVARAIPTFCFGLLHLRLSQAWEDAIQGLKDMAQYQQAETVISEIASSWLKGGEPEEHPVLPPSSIDADAPTRVYSDFECSNLLLMEAKCQRAQTELENSQEKLQQRFDVDHAQNALRVPANRSQILRALNAMPQLAEKRSRLLVPVLLEWADEDAASSHTLGEDDEVMQRWTRKDQKAMLDIFAQSQNPRVLYKSADVYRALLSLLSNGDAEIQKSALKAVLAWKMPAVNRYQEHLMNLLDDARFREEVSIFLNPDQEDAIRVEDCPDLMPVLLRLLYGKAVARAGTASGQRGQQTRRKAIFGALARFPTSTTEQFVDIALGPIASIELIRDGKMQATAVKELGMNPRKQLGTLNMLGDMLETLGTELKPFAHKFANAILLCLIKATNDPDAANEEGGNRVAAEDYTLSLNGAVRKSGYHCLVQLFSSCPNIEWSAYVDAIMQELLGPRLEKLPIETAQSVSSILKLFSAWVASPNLAVKLSRSYPRVLTTVADCLVVPSAKPEVKIFVIEQVIGKLIALVGLNVATSTAIDIDGLALDEAEIRNQLLKPAAMHIMLQIGEVLKQNPPKELLDSSVLCVSRLAPLVQGTEATKTFIDVSTRLLRQPTKRVQPSTKRDLLQTLVHLVPQAELHTDNARFADVYEALCPLFAFFRDRESRDLLCQILHTLSTENTEVAEVADLCTELNAFSPSRLDEPDFERRSLAFNKINEVQYGKLTADQWRPLLHNMLYYIRDNEELAIRTSASFSLRKFIQAASEQDDFKDAKFQDLASTVLLPGIQHGMREQSELVRAEYLSVMAHLIKHFPQWSAVNDMLPLLVNDDEDASFFNNVLHIQQHRRMRALRRLATEARAGSISSGNVSRVFIPLLEHFIFDPAQDEGAHNLTAESITSLSALLEASHWSQYQATLKRFVGYIKSKPDLQKTVLRLIGAAVESLHHASLSAKKRNGETAAVEEGVNGDAPLVSELEKSLPSIARLASDIIKDMLPPLTDYLHLKDESTVSLRVPVAIAIVKLLQVLPDDELAQRLPSVLMDVSQILRSRDQGSRDITRKSLAEIAALLGPSYFSFVVKELRSALQRGYQLHVLSFTVHSILVENSALLKPGDLDACLPEIVSIITDDIFGVTGQEKDAEDYISKMKEVKSSKSFDSMELVAKITTLPHLSNLIKPLQTLLMEKLDLRTVKKIDELLRRIGLGTSHNQGVKDRDILIFCYEIIQQVNAASATTEAKPKSKFDDYKTRKYLIQMQSASKSGGRGATTSYVFKLVRFAFDLMRSVLQGHEDLKTPANLAGFLPMVGDALVGGQEEVQLSAVRLLTSIIKVPAPKIEADAPVYAVEAISIIRAAPSTTTELAQAALKLVSAVLRERPNAKIRENDLAFLLKRVKPDLEEPDRQGVIFNFLKALLGRKIVITEVYEVLDTVASIMVTNQTRTARDLARGIYFQFIMEYPQGKDRLSKQVGFLVKNLEYQYVEGRQSVLELLHLLLSKTHGDLVQDLSSMLFVPLVMVMVNDDSTECREMAGALISKILEKADDERRTNYLDLLRSWLEQDEQILLRRVALQCWTMHIGLGLAQPKELTLIMKHVTQVLPAEGNYVEVEDWELLYYALQAFAKISEKAPAIALSAKQAPLWASVYQSLLFPHAWVKLSAARLLGVLFADIGSTSSQHSAGLASVPLRTSGGLELDETQMRRLCESSIRVLKFTGVTEQLATQSARNLIFLGRCFGTSGMDWKSTAVPTPTSNEVGEEEAAEASEEEESEDEKTSKKPITNSALSHLIGRLAAILRRDFTSMRAPSLYPKTSALQTIASLCSSLPTATVTQSLETILLPLHHLTDASIPGPVSTDTAFTDAYKTLTSMAAEVMSLLQGKLGTTEYVNVMGRVQKKVRDRREGRRQKRRIEAVSQPEKWHEDKRRKYEGKKVKRKEKGGEARGRRRGW